MTTILLKDQAFSSNNNYNSGSHVSRLNVARNFNKDSPSDCKTNVSTYRKFTSGFFNSEFVRKYPRKAALFMLFTINANKEGLYRLSSGEFLNKYPEIVSSKQSFFRALDWLEEENYITTIRTTVGTSIVVKDFKERQAKKRYVRVYCEDFRKLIRKYDLSTANKAKNFFEELKKFYKEEIETDIARKESFEVRKTQLKDSAYAPDKTKSACKTAHLYIYSKGYCNIGFNKTFNKAMVMKKEDKEAQEQKFQEYRTKVNDQIDKDTAYIKQADISQEDFENTNKIKDIFSKYLKNQLSGSTRSLLEKHVRIFSLRKKQIFVEVFNFSAKNGADFDHVVTVFRLFHQSVFLNMLRNRYKMDVNSIHIIMDDKREQQGGISDTETRMEIKCR